MRQNTEFNDVAQLQETMRSNGAVRAYAKRLAPNDNSKNQPYLGGDFTVLGILPYGTVYSERKGSRPNFKAKLDFYWIAADGSLSHAPGAQLILYPKYPESRLSGFLKSCSHAPSELMNSRAEGRILFLGVCDDGRILAHVTAADTALANSFDSLGTLARIGVFLEIPMPGDQGNSKEILLQELRRIHLKKWIDSKRLTASGRLQPCKATHCGGMTLEAELGITPNGRSEPDYRGWEVKQHGVTHLSKPDTGTITLMTPEPTGGYYREHGVEAFVRRFGYPDKLGRPDRLNFGGVHKVGERHPTTGLTMQLYGFDATNHKITDLEGGIVLRNDDDVIAAEWSFAHIIEHWNRKHAKAVYVPSVNRREPLQYWYGSIVRLGTGPDPLKLLEAMTLQAVYYDPGIKLESATKTNSKTKRRSQFRIRIKSVGTLYENFEQIDILKGQ